MLRRRKKRQTLLTEKKERIITDKTHYCLRTECLLSAILIGVLALFVTWGSSAIVKSGYELVQSRASLIKIEAENELLRLELAQLKSPERIREIAVGQLGLVRPNVVYMASIESTAARTTVTNAEAAPARAQRSSLFGNALAEAHTSR
jgi:cell division protein FtsB